MASTSLALTIASQFCCINSGWYPKLIFLGVESLCLSGLVTRLLLFTVLTLGFWQRGGLRSGRVQHVSKRVGHDLSLLRYHTSFFFRDRKVFTSVPQGLHLDI